MIATTVMITPSAKSVAELSVRHERDERAELHAEQQEDRRVQQEDDELPHGARLQSRRRDRPRWRGSAADTRRPPRTRARPRRGAIPPPTTPRTAPASVSSVSASASFVSRSARTMSHATSRPTSDADAGVDEEPNDRLAPAEHARHCRRDRGAIEDERRRVVHEALALEDRDHAARHRQPRDDRGGGDGVRRRDDRAECHRDGPGHVGEERARDDRDDRRGRRARARSASVPILSMLRLNSRSDVNIAADQSTGGRNTKKTRSGSSEGIAIPGTSATPNPAASCRIGVGMGSRRANAESATTSTTTTMAVTTGSKCGIAGGAGKNIGLRTESIS